jgi:lipopolysaccharide export LptBFGC system permease protein LptF
MNNQGRLVVGIGSIILAVFLVIRGRALGFHLTEGEMLIALWPYWLMAAVLAFVGAWLIWGRRNG